MRRIIILLLGLLAATGRQVPAQVTAVSGELRYQHRYQDILSGGLLSTSRQRSPILSLGIRGEVVSPRLAIFSLRTNLSSTFNSAGAGTYAFTGSQYSWDYYDFTAGLLQYSLLKFDLGARDGVLETSTDRELEPPLVSRSRRRQQRIAVSTNKIRFLPSTNFSHERTRAWSLAGDPFEQRSEITSLAMSTVNGSTSLSVSGSLADISESTTGMRERYLAVQVDGQKEFDARNRVDVSSSYNSYPGFRSLSGSASYAGSFSERFSAGTSVFGTLYSGGRASTRVLTASQVLRLIQDEHFQYAFTGLVRSRNEARAPSGDDLPDRIEEVDWQAGFDAQHVRNLGFANLSNSFSAFYGEQHALDTRRTLGGRMNLGLQSTLRRVQMSASYSLGGDILENQINRRHVSQNADARITAELARRISSVSGMEFRDDRYAGDIQSFRDRRTLVARQSFAAGFNTIIPFTLGLGGSVTWYYTGVVGRTYGWNGSFSSGEFFVRGLSATYRYTRTYDPYYRKEVLEQTAEFRMRWRRLLFELRFRQYDLFHRIRDILFTVSRPF